MLGKAQEAWFNQQVTQAKAPWNLIAQSTLFGKRDFKIGPGERFWNDGWDGYAPARERMLKVLASNTQAMPVMIGGDVHANWVGHISSDYDAPNAPRIGVEFTGAGISARGASDGNKAVSRLLGENPHFVFADQERNGYGVLELTPKQLTTTLRVVDDAARKDTAVSTLAQFVVQAGNAAVIRN